MLGYSVVGILFQSNGGYNLDAFLGKAILGLLQAFFFTWTYFDFDANDIGIHAIRRSAVAMATSLPHPPCPCLVLSTDMSNTHPEQLTENYRALAEEEFSTDVLYFYCHGLAIAPLSMTAIAISYKHHSVGMPRLAKRYRLASPVAVAIIMFFPAASSGTSVAVFLSHYLGLDQLGAYSRALNGLPKCIKRNVRGGQEEGAWL